MSVDAGRLVGFALQPRLTTARSGDYEQLVNRYLTDLEFRDAVDAVADGLGLAVLDASVLRLIVAPSSPASTFSFRRHEPRAGTQKFDERVCTGLIHLGIVCLAYPTAQDLAADRVPRLSVLHVDGRLRAAAERAHEGSAQDPPADQPELERAWSVYARQPATSDTKDGRAYLRGTLRWVRREFEWLEANDLAHRETDDELGRFRLTRRHRIMARGMAVPAAARTLLEAKA